MTWVRQHSPPHTCTPPMTDGFGLMWRSATRWQRFRYWEIGGRT